MFSHLMNLSRLKRAARQFGFFRPVPEGTQKQQLWSIGIYVGSSPLAFAPADFVQNPVLTRDDISDIRALFIADPFMMKVKESWYMFFEIYNADSGKGDIGYAASHDGFTWKYQRLVLSEAFHLSYPYVFQWADEYYMIPETYSLGEVRLYKAHRFPTDWTYVATLLSGDKFSDSSIFRYQNMWWLFTCPNPELRQDTLSLYFSTELGDRWCQHPRSPIIKSNPHIARPAGRVLVSNDRIIRYAQDCQPIYGTSVRAFEVDNLTTETYAEQQRSYDPLLGPSGEGWNEGGMHHLDPHLIEGGRWVACVDGWTGVETLDA